MFSVRELSSHEKTVLARAFWSANVMLRQQPVNEAVKDAWLSAFSELSQTNPYQALLLSFDPFICLTLLDPNAARKMEDAWTVLLKAKAPEDPSLALVILSEAQATLKLYLGDIDEIEAYQSVPTGSFTKRIDVPSATRALQKMQVRLAALSQTLNDISEKTGPRPPFYTPERRYHGKSFVFLKPFNDNQRPQP